MAVHIAQTIYSRNLDATTLHHIALNVALEDLESEKRRLDGLGLKAHAMEHEWIHVRSMYFRDPEENLLELSLTMRQRDS